MQENVKISKKKQTIKKIFFVLKKKLKLLYLLHKCLNMLERQTSVYVSTFMQILLFQAYKYNIRLKLGKP